MKVLKAEERSNIMEEIRKELRVIRDSQIRTETQLENIIEDHKEQKLLVHPINRAYQSIKWLIGAAAIIISLFFGGRKALADDMVNPPVKVVKVSSQH